MQIRLFISLLLLMCLNLFAQAQNAVVRGNVYDKDTGEPIMFGTVRLIGTDRGASTDLEGFFNFTDVEPGEYTISVTYVGYDSLGVDIVVRPNAIVYKQLYMEGSSVQLQEVSVSARKEKARSEVAVSQLTITSDQIRSLPSTGGEADIAQYLPVIPGIITTGDQGGQLYIRGGAPIQNLIMLDGMPIYNPFHSIGFFSVFETETIRSVDVQTGGFNAEYGGRISAIVDIKTREGNKRRFGGLVSANPFMGKVLLEGPISKLKDEGGSSSSFLLTGKHSYIDQTSKTLYNYAQSALDTSLNGLPFSFTDIFGKISLLSGNGSKLNVFGFNFNDRVSYSIADLSWNSFGGGANFTLIPPNSNTIMGGTVGYSSYDIELIEGDGNPRQSSITSLSAMLNFSNFGLNNQVDYGFIFTALSTDFLFRNFLDITIERKDFTTELGAWLIYKQKFGDWIVEPSLRAQLYTSQRFMLEPRLGIKFNATERLRFKMAGGMYSQNLLSSVNERDVVNLFVGFLSGPEETIFRPSSSEPVTNRLQRSIHAIGGFELDLSNKLSMNVEAYIKQFTQLINVNRAKLEADDPDFATETGSARGVDLSLRYENSSLYVWATYSLGNVQRDDGIQVYPTVFDRRHNVNLLASYTFGKTKDWEFGIRWNYGSAFPFTQTQGFYPSINFFEEGLDTDPVTANPPLGVIFDEDRNGGRLVPYHRLDGSLKRTIEFSKYSSLEITLSITNLYNRQNIFYIDRRTNERVDQLPILPSLGVTLSF